MERKKFINLCKLAEALPNRVFSIKEYVPKELRVQYKGTEYYPKAYMIGFKKEMNKIIVIHKAVLHDLYSNSEMVCNLSEVKNV